MCTSYGGNDKMVEIVSNLSFFRWGKQNSRSAGRASRRWGRWRSAISRPVPAAGASLPRGLAHAAKRRTLWPSHKIRRSVVSGDRRGPCPWGRGPLPVVICPFAPRPSAQTIPPWPGRCERRRRFALCPRRRSGPYLPVPTQSRRCSGFPPCGLYGWIWE